MTLQEIKEDLKQKGIKFKEVKFGANGKIIVDSKGNIYMGH